MPTAVEGSRGSWGVLCTKNSPPRAWSWGLTRAAAAAAPEAGDPSRVPCLPDSAPYSADAGHPVHRRVGGRFVIKQQPCVSSESSLSGFTVCSHRAWLCLRSRCSSHLLPSLYRPASLFLLMPAFPGCGHLKRWGWGVWLCLAPPSSWMCVEGEGQGRLGRWRAVVRLERGRRAPC